MSRSDRILVAGIGGALVLAIAAGALLLMPAGDAAEASASATLLLATPDGSAVASAAPSGGGTSSGTIVVDVEGAVAEPGVRQLPAGSRIADAVAAAGGYAADVDLAAAAAAVNLAQPVSDGEQIYIPRVGEAAIAVGDGGAGESQASAPPGGGGGAAGGGLVDLNTASPEQLEALPGIGPVTVQKIVAARQEQPFASLEDAVTRGALNRGQLEDIQGLATAG